MSGPKQQDGQGKGDLAKLPADPNADEIISELSRQISSILPAGQREQVLSRVATVVRSEAFRGPIAHPKHLEHYEKVCPGAADRIIAMAEKEQSDRIDWMMKNQSADHADKQRGMYCGLIAFVILVAAAIFCGWMGQPILGGSFLATGVLGAVGLFINGRMQGPANGNGTTD